MNRVIHIPRPLGLFLLISQLVAVKGKGGALGRWSRSESRDSLGNVEEGFSEPKDIM